MLWRIWILVPIVYGLFSLWYFNWSGPITADEVEAFMTTFENAEGKKHTDAKTFRTFLEEDDGGEFVMLNLVELRSGEVEHPVSREKMSASQLLSGYIEPFTLALFKRGGHPVFQAHRVGGNIDSWNAKNNLSFDMAAMMRYRSRRDLVELIVDPAFSGGHVYKLAAIERTISYPTSISFSMSLRPPVTVLLVLILLASLVQNWVVKHRPGSPT